MGPEPSGGAQRRRCARYGLGLSGAAILFACAHTEPNPLRYSFAGGGESGDAGAPPDSISGAGGDAQADGGAGAGGEPSSTAGSAGAAGKAGSGARPNGGAGGESGHETAGAAGISDAGDAGGGGGDETRAGASGGPHGGSAGAPEGGSSGTGGPGAGTSGSGVATGGASGFGGAFSNCDPADSSIGDFDGDGVPDRCDDDDDDDGFPDTFDQLAPNDPRSPGGFPLGAPGAILAHACVERALEQIAANKPEYPLRTERLVSASIPRGYFRRETGAGQVIATTVENRTPGPLVGAEQRYDLVGADVVDLFDVDFNSSGEVGYTIGRNYVIRGHDGEYTLYGAGYGSVLIHSFVLAENGDWLANTLLWVRLPASGPHDTCPSGYGTWILSYWPQHEHLGSADELLHLCLDGGSGYIPDERWRNADGELCTCTASYEVMCPP